jgi:hypothetical protein
MAGGLSRLEDEHFHRFIGHVAFEPDGTLLDPHVDVEPPQITGFLLGLQSALDELGDSLIVCLAHSGGAGDCSDRNPQHETSHLFPPE